MFPLIKSIKAINLNSKEERILALSSSLSLSFKDIYLKGKDNCYGWQEVDTASRL